MKEIDKYVRRHAKFKSIVHTENNIFLKPLSIKGSKDRVEESELTQTNLVEIYSLNNLTEKEMNYVMPLFNMIWGSGSLESKLYKSLREEHSLCYNVTTFYQKYDFSLIVHTAIDEENTKLALKLIKESLSKMCKGVIEEEELENVKNLLITSLNLILDSPNRLIDMYLFKNIADLKDIEDRIDELKKVTIKDLVLLAKKINLIMTFRIRGE